jgi:hypothetical protein
LRQLRSLTADEHINYPIGSFAFPFLSRTRRGSELAETAISCGGRDSAKAAVARSGAPVGAPDFFCLRHRTGLPTAGVSEEFIAPGSSQVRLASRHRSGR